MKNKKILFIIGMIFLAFFLRSLNLVRGFEGDEAVTLRSAMANFSHIIPTLVKYDSHPPLTSILLHFWMALSKNEIFIRYYFILFGIGALFTTYLISREYFQEKPQVSCLVLFLGAISPLLISLSQFIRNYIDSAFFMLLSNYFFLLILKNKGTKGIWFGYLVSSLLSIYSFYFSMIIIFSQSIYMFIFKSRERNIIKKWILCQITIALLFLPWLPNFFNQFFNKGSSGYLPWDKFGFKFAGLRLGIYARNISSLFGFDYFFMVYPQGIKEYFGQPILFLMAGLAFLLLIYFLFLTVKWLRKEFKNQPELTWFLPMLALLPMVISWISAKVFKTLPNARYLALPHSVFLMLISYFFYNLISRYKKVGTSLLVLFISLYALRIPMAITPAYEGRKALQFLQTNVRGGDCTVMAGDYLPGREELAIPAFSIEKYLLEMDPLTAKYRVLPEASTKKITDTLKPFKRIWLISCYGNTEIFGGNKIVYDFLRRCGRKEISTKEFHNYKLILME